ncbi:MAG: GNAT family N-acetyltransferase [Planctomycetota bacterium]
MKLLLPYRIEHLILSRPYFDPAGLIFAVELADDHQDDPSQWRFSQGKPIGFVHASFAPSDDLSDLDLSTGIISQLKIRSDGDYDRESIADQLLTHGLNYLKGRGAKSVAGGGLFPFAPFYVGLYGGSEIPGVLSKDSQFHQTLTRNAFEQQDRVVIMQRRLAEFRPIGGRDQLSVRRKYQINAVVDPKENSWWETCTLGMANKERFSIYHKQNQRVCGNVSFWDMQPLAGGGPNTARGMYGLNVPEEFRRSGIATFLVGEALKYYMQQGVEYVEAQTLASETAAIGVFEKLGFEHVDEGVLLSKSL